MTGTAIARARRGLALLLALTILTAGTLAGCRRGRTEPPAAGEGATASAASTPGGATSVIIAGDDLPYVASFIAMAAMPVDRGVMAAAVNLNSFVVGPASFVLMNKWSKLPEGQYVETFKVLGPDRETVIIEGATRFNSDGFDRNTLVVYAIEHEFSAAGTYWVRISLDETLFAEYPFRVRQGETY